MDTRTRLAIGGMATVAASVAVICVVALTNSMALSDSAGSSIDAAPVVVPASGAAGASGSAPTPTPTPTPIRTQKPVTPPTAEVVPAPDAQVVNPTHSARPPQQSSGSSDKPAGSTPQPSGSAPKPSGPSAPSSLDEAIAQAEASGSWDPVRAWLERAGWSQGRIQAFIAKLERTRGDGRFEIDAGRDSGREKGKDKGGQSVNGDASRTSSWTDSAKTKGKPAFAGSSKDRTAKARANAGHRAERPGTDAKKDRSRDSHVRRDR